MDGRALGNFLGGGGAGAFAFGGGGVGLGGAGAATGGEKVDGVVVSGVVGLVDPSFNAFSPCRRSCRSLSRSSASFSAAFAFSSASFFSLASLSSTDVSSFGEELLEGVTPSAAIRS